MTDPARISRATPPLAVVGLACRFPDADDPAALLDVVLTGRRAFRRLPPGRFDLADYYHPDLATSDATYSTRAALIDGWQFERAAFAIDEPAYVAADPAHWLALETAARALSAAGLTAGTGLNRDRTGVIMGNTLAGDTSRANALRVRWPYVRRVLADALSGAEIPASQAAPVLQQAESGYLSPFPPMGALSLAGSMPGTIATAISSYFGFRGGSHAVDSACSSALQAVASGCAALVTGDLDAVIAGGVDLSLDPLELIGLAKAGLLATSDVRVYDEHPTGYLPGEGCGVVVLMRAADARAANLPVYAEILGWGVSSGAKPGGTQSQASSQLLAMERAYERSAVDPADIHFIEGNGASSPLADEAELTALNSIRAGAKHPAALGSVKANIGHAKAAAGAAGLIKAVLALSTGVVPPTTGAQSPHQLISEGDGNLVLPKAVQDWEPGTRLAAVSATGIGGSNVHLVLRHEPEARARQDRRHRSGPLLAKGTARRTAGTAPSQLTAAPAATQFLLHAPGRSELSALLSRIADVAEWLSDAEMQDLACTLGRDVDTQGQVRVAIVAIRQEQLAKLAREALTMLPYLVDGLMTVRPGIYASDNADGRVTLLLSADKAGVSQQEPAAAAITPAVTRSLATLRWLDSLEVHANAAVGHGIGGLAGLAWAGALGESEVLEIAHLRALFLRRSAERQPPAPEAGAKASSDATGLSAAIAERFRFGPPRRLLISTLTGREVGSVADAIDLICEGFGGADRVADAIGAGATGASLLLETGPGHSLVTAAADVTKVPAISLNSGLADPASIARASAALFAAGALGDPKPLFAGRQTRPLDIWREHVFITSPCAAEVSTTDAPARDALVDNSPDDGSPADAGPGLTPCQFDGDESRITGAEPPETSGVGTPPVTANGAVALTANGAVTDEALTGDALAGDALTADGALADDALADDTAEPPPAGSAPTEASAIDETLANDSTVDKAFAGNGAAAEIRDATVAISAGTRQTAIADVAAIAQILAAVYAPAAGAAADDAHVNGDNASGEHTDTVHAGSVSTVHAGSASGASTPADSVVADAAVETAPAGGATPEASAADGTLAFPPATDGTLAFPPAADGTLAFPPAADGTLALASTTDDALNGPPAERDPANDIPAVGAPPDSAAAASAAADSAAADDAVAVDAPVDDVLAVGASSDDALAACDTDNSSSALTLQSLAEDESRITDAEPHEVAGRSTPVPADASADDAPDDGAPGAEAATDAREPEPEPATVAEVSSATHPGQGQGTAAQETAAAEDGISGVRGEFERRLPAHPLIAAAAGQPGVSAEQALGTPAEEKTAPQEPAVAEPTAELATHEPSAAEPAAAEVALHEPRPQGAAAVEPTAELATHEPAAAEPAAAQAALHEPRPQEAAVAEPTVAEPVTGEPATAGPAAAEPTPAHQAAAQQAGAEQAGAEQADPPGLTAVRAATGRSDKRQTPAPGDRDAAADEIAVPTSPEITSAPGLGSWTRCFAAGLRPARRPVTQSAPLPWRKYSAARSPILTDLSESFAADAAAARTLAVVEDPSDERSCAAAIGAAKDAITTGELLVLTTNGGFTGFFGSLHAEHPSIGITILRVQGDPADPNSIRPDSLMQFASVQRGVFRELVLGPADSVSEPVLTEVELTGGSDVALGPEDVIMITRATNGAGLALAQVVACCGGGIAVIGRAGEHDDAELVGGLEDLRGAGARVGYEIIDIDDPASVAGAIERIEDRLGPVTAIAHSAGLADPAAVHEIAEAEATAHVGDEAAILDLLASSVRARQLRLIISVGTVASRYGLAGASLHALSSAALASRAAELAAAGVGCEVLHLDLAAWSATGLGNRPELAEELAAADTGALDFGVACRLLLKIMSTPGLPRNLAIHGRVGGLPASPAPVITRAELAAAGLAGGGAFLREVNVNYPGAELVCSARLSLASDPYLGDYRIDGMPVLPPVLALEALSQAASVLAGQPLRRMTKVTLESPVLIPTSRDAVLRVSALRNGDTIVAALRCADSSYVVDHAKAEFSWAGDPDEMPQAATAADPFAVQKLGAEPSGLVDGVELYGPICFQSGRFRRIALLPEVTARSGRAVARGSDERPWFPRDSPLTSTSFLLGSPGLNDAALQVLQACVPHRRVRPAGCESVQFAGRSAVGPVEIRAIAEPARALPAEALVPSQAAAPASEMAQEPMAAAGSEILGGADLLSPARRSWRGRRRHQPADDAGTAAGPNAAANAVAANDAAAAGGQAAAHGAASGAAKRRVITPQGEPRKGAASQQARVPLTQLWNVEAVDADGQLLAAWRGIRLRDSGPLPRSAAWPPTLLSVFLERRAADLGLDDGLRVTVSCGHPEGPLPELLTTMPPPGDSMTLAEGRHAGPERRTMNTATAAGTGALAGFSLMLRAPVPVACGWVAAELAHRHHEPAAGMAAAYAQLRAEVTEAPSVLAARLAATSGALQMAGLEADRAGGRQLIVTRTTNDGWVVFALDRALIACAVVELSGVSAPVAIAMLTKHYAHARSAARDGARLAVR